jgi:plasmid stabilization system protein ParE
MALRIIIRPLAEEDLSSAVKWYILESEKLAAAFLFEFNDAVNIVSRVPLGFQKKYKTVRAFALKKFPYNVYYIVNKNTMYIVAVLHQKRNPKLLKKRK